MPAHVEIDLLVSAIMSGIDGTQPGEFQHGVTGVCRVLSGRTAYNPTKDRYNAMQVMQAILSGIGQRVNRVPFGDSFFELIVSNFTKEQRDEFLQLGGTIPSAITEPDSVLIEMGFFKKYATQNHDKTVYLV